MTRVAEAARRENLVSLDSCFDSLLRWRWLSLRTIRRNTHSGDGFYAARDGDALGPEHFVVGVVLLIGWVILLAATQRSLGFLGLMLGGAFTRWRRVAAR